MENRWWEYYAVRYFVGTVVGAVVVTSLNSDPCSPFQAKVNIRGDTNDVTILGVGLVAALGFAFCYVASAPVLTLHATRAHLRLSAAQASPLSHLFSLLVPTGMAIWAFWRFLPPLAAVGSGVVVGIQAA